MVSLWFVLIANFQQTAVFKWQEKRYALSKGYAGIGVAALRSPTCNFHYTLRYFVEESWTLTFFYM